jgi:hypothetical protein
MLEYLKKDLTVNCRTTIMTRLDEYDLMNYIIRKKLLKNKLAIRSYINKSSERIVIGMLSPVKIKRSVADPHYVRPSRVMINQRAKRIAIGNATRARNIIILYSLLLFFELFRILLA